MMPELSLDELIGRSERRGNQVTEATIRRVYSSFEDPRADEYFVQYGPSMTVEVLVQEILSAPVPRHLWQFHRQVLSKDPKVMTHIAH
jgi:hypothetical protein